MKRNAWIRGLIFIVVFGLTLGVRASVQSADRSGECVASFDFQSNILRVPCFSFGDNAYYRLDWSLISDNPIQFQLANYQEDTDTVCLDDDIQNGIYRICNYFPLNRGNHWEYTTGDRTVINETRTCATGYSGVRYGTTTYEFEPFMAVNGDGLMFAGCQYDEGVIEEITSRVIFFKSAMYIGQSELISMPQEGFSFTSRLVGIEQVTVPAGTFNALKFVIDSAETDGSCSYRTTLWLVKGVGPVKIHRTHANPANCLGCMFVCDPNNNVTRLNTPAELIWAAIDGKRLP